MTVLEKVLASGASNSYVASYLQAAYRCSKARLTGDISPERRAQEEQRVREYRLEARKRGVKLIKRAPMALCTTTTVTLDQHGEMSVRSVGSSLNGLPRVSKRPKPDLPPVTTDGGTLLSQLEASLAQVENGGAS